ncbi:hypothetical protein L1765_10070 [Microaerobacter geothermalis]|uniref:hypothetical protein n=1 Tax=Microaerobacter geothermalis TaxID=674972 RepID=UPI001F3FBE95|nr:hypothetical protein [Microaerobacter geothermalis]MCF6094308.1 hypothetical protein [Microaerobacter geothermalis]
MNLSQKLSENQSEAKGKKKFEDRDIKRLLANWNGRYVLKTQFGQTISAEMIKEYKIQKDHPETKRFVLTVNRLYRFLSLEGLDDRIILTCSVKPDSLEEFMQFSKELSVIEKKLEQVV